jgi:hypothetical protein
LTVILPRCLMSNVLWFAEHVGAECKMPTFPVEESKPVEDMAVNCTSSVTKVHVQPCTVLSLLEMFPAEGFGRR